MISRSFATVAALTILGAPLVLVAQRGPTSVSFGTKLISHSGFLDAPAVSPDGKWIAAMSQSASDNSIVIASATGGTFRPLVPAADRPLQLVWSPRGDRVAYMSGRVGGVVVSDFDTSTGALRGTPRRVTLERTWQYAIAPDGQSLAYVLKVKDEQVLKIVPLAGGTARDVLRWPAIALDNVRFAVDGKSLYFDVRSPTERGSVYRVSSTGGKPELVWKPMQPEGTTTLVEPSIDRILRLTQTTIVLMTLEGDTVLVMPNFTDSQLRIGAFSADGRSLFVAPSDVRAIMRATPLDGGKSVDLSPNTDYYWPVGWSSDSRSAYFTTEAAHSLYVAGLDGSARRTIAFDRSEERRVGKECA